MSQHLDIKVKKFGPVELSYLSLLAAIFPSSKAEET